MSESKYSIGEIENIVQQYKNHCELPSKSSPELDSFRKEFKAQYEQRLGEIETKLTEHIKILARSLAYKVSRTCASKLVEDRLNFVVSDSLNNLKEKSKEQYTFLRVQGRNRLKSFEISITPIADLIKAVQVGNLEVCPEFYSELKEQLAK